MALKIVVDSSVLLKWVKTKDEGLVQEAQQLLRGIEKERMEVHVPALLLYEVGNALVLRTRLSVAALEEAIEHLEELPFVVAPPASPLLKRAARVARELGVTFYDASFLALAVELDCRFVTADNRLFERARTFHWVRHLSRVGAIL